MIKKIVFRSLQCIAVKKIDFSSTTGLTHSTKSKYMYAFTIIAQLDNVAWYNWDFNWMFFQSNMPH